MHKDALGCIKMHWETEKERMISTSLTNYGPGNGIIAQDGITCGAIDEASRTSNAIEKRVIINFRDKNAVIARFRDKNFYR